jgi:hypothetical protein
MLLPNAAALNRSRLLISKQRKSSLEPTPVFPQTPVGF